MTFPPYVEPPSRTELAKRTKVTRWVCVHCGEEPSFCSSNKNGFFHEFRNLPLCGFCGGQGGRMRGGDPQTEETCPVCDGTGVEGL